jgi:hypothetical protein
VFGIRINFGRLDPDPGGQKCPTKIEKVKNFMFSSAEWSLLRVEGLFVAWTSLIEA